MATHGHSDHGAHEHGAHGHGAHGHGAHGHEGRHGAHGHEGRHGAAPGERTVAQGTITSISGTGFVLATEEDEVKVITDGDTNFHGLSRRQAKEAGYQDPTAVNTFAALRVGQRVGVMGERRDDATLLARRVHGFEP